MVMVLKKCYHFGQSFLGLRSGCTRKVAITHHAAIQVAQCLWVPELIALPELSLDAFAESNLELCLELFTLGAPGAVTQPQEDL